MEVNINKVLEECHTLLERGLAHHAAGQLADAEQTYRKALSLVPKYDPALHQLGVLAYQVGNLPVALTLIGRAIEYAPQHAHYWANKALVHAAQGAYREAVDCCRQALRLKPDFVEVYNNLGVMLTNGGWPKEAEKSLRKALAMRPNDFEARANLGNLLLLQGRYKEAWPEFECRVENRDERLPAALAAVPKWRGEPLRGQRLLLLAERSIGEQILMVRFAERLSTQGASVDILTSPALTELFSSVRGVRNVFSAIPEPARSFFDFRLPMLSLPAQLQVDLGSIPVHMPYIKPNDLEVTRWEARLQTHGPTTLRVGLAWADCLVQENKGLPGIRTDDLAQLQSLRQVQFFSLQKGDAATALSTIDWKIPSLGPYLKTLTDTAAVIANLDLVITADMVLAHLAGALGKPVWVLLPTTPEWCWMLERPDCPWYPSARVYRQQVRNSWRPLIDSVYADLLRLTARQAA